MESPVLFYDGYCVFCNFWVKFLYSKQKRQTIYFASLESETLSKLSSLGVEVPLVDSAFYWDGKRLYSKSDMAIQVLRQCYGIWYILGFFLGIFPRFIRNFGYDCIATVRYKVFGKFDACPVPPPEVRNLFLK
ncbi:MAG: DCC1-like thiol-disulfide oxidoreductase family protein [Bacteroidia bacterium]|nr:DCC1-like thiol-disulfide oxidoreductase family protein [Bacteroidia bacterium]